MSEEEEEEGEAASASVLRALEALVGRAGGRQRLLLVAERRAGEAPPRALLERFARDLFGEASGPSGAPERGADPPRWGRAEARRGAGRRWPRCPLAFVLCRPSGGRRRGLGEVVRDVRGQLAPSAGLVGVLVGEGPEPPGAEREAARLRLEALLRRAAATPGAPRGATQAAHYSPGAPQPVRRAALRALRAALQLTADGLETEKQRLPAFLRCFSWGRRSRKTSGCLDKPADPSRDDGTQETEEGVALINMVPNGNCEEICGGAGRWGTGQEAFRYTQDALPSTTPGLSASGWDTVGPQVEVCAKC
uniref:uncharacterized protein C2orf72 homolog n=1 Tax=Euleptes europaea TaxID=460621 RepID=UPI0025406267|nr:uncharacterized protein C2orf72 homolog [Euleptes europaea]